MEKNVLYKVPVILFACIVPIIMRAKRIVLSNEMYQIYNGSKSVIDFYAYNKMILIMISFILALVLFLLLKKEKKALLKPIINKMLLIMALLTVLSSLFSDYGFISYFGIIERYEGMFVLLAYIFFVFYINSFVEDFDDIRFIIYAIVISSSVIGLIGFLEYFGYNPLNTYLGKRLITPFNMTSIMEDITFTIKKGGISSTLYNPNYVGSYMVMTFFIGLSMIFSNKKITRKLLWSIYTFLMLFNLIGSSSAAGKVGFLFGIIMLIIIYRKNVISTNGIFLGIFLILFFIMPILIGNNSGVLNEVSRQVSSMSQEVVEKKIIDKNFDLDYDSRLFSIKYTDNNGEINKLEFVLTNNLLEMRLNDNPLDIKVSENKSTLDISDDFIKEKFTIEMAKEHNGIYVNYIDKFSVILKFTTSGFELLDSNYRPIDKIKGYEEFHPLVGREFLGSSRGYIWKMSIPLLKDNILLGSGPDTFGVVYPQNDLIGKFKYMFSALSYVDKPHNMYMQMGIQTGVLSVLIYIIILILYGLDTLKLYFFSKFDTIQENIALGLFLSVFTFSVAAIFNDSNVSVSPLYWTILGLGIQINNMNKKAKGV